MAPFITHTEHSDLATWAKITRSKIFPQPTTEAQVCKGPDN